MMLVETEVRGFGCLVSGPDASFSDVESLIRVLFWMRFLGLGGNG